MTPRLCKTTAAHPFGEEGDQGREGAEGRRGEGRREEEYGGQGRRKQAALFPFHPVAFAICIVRTLSLGHWMHVNTSILLRAHQGTTGLPLIRRPQAPGIS